MYYTHNSSWCCMANTDTSLSLCSDQVINLWKGFGVKDDQVLLRHIKHVLYHDPSLAEGFTLAVHVQSEGG